MPDSDFTDGIRPQWAPRVPQHKIRKLYEMESRGQLDEVLVDDVGIAIYLRCQSILVVSEAHHGRALCPRCSTIILHHARRWDTITCQQSVWQTTWGAYKKTYQDKQLFGGLIGAPPPLRCAALAGKRPG